MAAAIHNAVYHWHDVPVKGVLVLEGDMNRNNHSAKYSLPV
jgi:hypothetical protein